MAMITSSKADRNFWPGDVAIENFEAAGLPVPSIVRMKLFTLDHRIIIDRLGILSSADRSKVQEKLREIFCL
jgi:mRNA interferase MazF